MQLSWLSIRLNGLKPLDFGYSLLLLQFLQSCHLHIYRNIENPKFFPWCGRWGPPLRFRKRATVLGATIWGCLRASGHFETGRGVHISASSVLCAFHTDDICLLIQRVVNLFQISLDSDREASRTGLKINSTQTKLLNLTDHAICLICINDDITEPDAR